MKKKRLIILGIFAVLVIAYVGSIYSKFRRRTEFKQTLAALQSLSPDRIRSAAQAFARDRKPADTTVPLRDLVVAGYLRPDDTHGLEMRDATISLSADESEPDTVWIRIRTGGELDIVVLADGSIQGVRR
jgi:hypothetical protein